MERRTGLTSARTHAFLLEGEPGLRACQPRGMFWPGKGVSLTEFSSPPQPQPGTCFSAGDALEAPPR